MKNSFFVKVLFYLLLTIVLTNCGVEKTSKLETGWYYIADKSRNDLVEKIKIKTQDTFYLNPIPVVTIPHFKEAVIYSGMVGNEGLQVIMNEEGTQLWSDATKLYARNSMGFVVDDELIHVQRIATQNKYGTTTLNEQWFDKEYLESLAAKLNREIPPGQK